MAPYLLSTVEDELHQWRHTSAVRLAAQADLVAKAALLVMLLLVVVDPTWGSLEGKAPVARAVTYPLLALVVPLLWWSRGRPRPYPWVSDLMVTIPGFNDVLGNRLDLYDRVVWFDDVMHFFNSVLLTAAFLALTRRGGETKRDWLAGAMAFGITISLAWELFEYRSFITRSDELASAYADTLLDLCLGWLGAVVAAGAVWLAVRWAPEHPRTGVAARLDGADR